VGGSVKVREWDSRFFGFRIGETHVSTREELIAADTSAERNEVRCLYLLVPSDCFSLVQHAESRGFRLTGVRMSFVAETPFIIDPTWIAGTRIREVQASDVEALENIATTAHPDTRFFADPGFDRDACKRLYATWIRRSAEGWADRVLVADADGRATGYVTLHRNGNEARIGLIAVADDTRRSGIGRALMTEAFRWCDQNSIPRISVATQAQNTSALRFYLRCGFGVDGVDFWLHKWWW